MISTTGPSCPFDFSERKGRLEVSDTVEHPHRQLNNITHPQRETVRAVIEEIRIGFMGLIPYVANNMDGGSMARTCSFLVQ